MRPAFENHPDPLHTRHSLRLDPLKHNQRIFLFTLCSVMNVVVCLSDGLFLVKSDRLVSKNDPALRVLDRLR